MTWQLRGRGQPRCGSGRMAAVWLRAPALCFLFTFLTCALQTGSQIDNRDNKIFGGFQNLQPKIYGDTIVMVVGYCLSNMSWQWYTSICERVIETWKPEDFTPSDFFHFSSFRLNDSTGVTLSATVAMDRLWNMNNHSHPPPTEANY